MSKEAKSAMELAVAVMNRSESIRSYLTLQASKFAVLKATAR